MNIEEKSFYMCPDRLRLPLIFYVAHPATLYINKLLLAGLITVCPVCKCDLMLVCVRLINSATETCQ